MIEWDEGINLVILVQRRTRWDEISVSSLNTLSRSVCILHSVILYSTVLSYVML